MLVTTGGDQISYWLHSKQEMSGKSSTKKMQSSSKRKGYYWARTGVSWSFPDLNVNEDGPTDYLVLYRHHVLVISNYMSGNYSVDKRKLARLFLAFRFHYTTEGTHLSFCAPRIVGLAQPSQRIDQSCGAKRQRYGILSQSGSSFGIIPSFGDAFNRYLRPITE